MPAHIFTEKERKEIREKMLSAGLSLLKQYGLTHMSVRKITEAAGIATGTFYHFWKNKEEYVAALSDYQETVILQEILTPEMKSGTKKPGKEEVRKFLKAITDDSQSIIPYLTLEDESSLFHQTTALIPDEKKESDKTRALLADAEGVREDISPLVIANLVKILALTVESREELHPSAYEKTIDCLIESILNQIF